MVMESRKAAPALRARLLRSYVPLRRDPSKSVLSGTISGLPGGNFLHPQIQIKSITTLLLLFQDKGDWLTKFVGEIPYVFLNILLK